MISAYREGQPGDGGGSSGDDDPGWAWLLRAAHDAEASLSPPPDTPVVRQLVSVVRTTVPEGRPAVIGHVAQSLDGRIALPDGQSQWITGEADLAHTHRLRALCDAVMVGANTIAADDPRLTVRRVSGPQPLRVVIDPRGRLGADHTVYADDHATLRVCRDGATALDGVDDLVVHDEVLVPELLRGLRARGVRRLFVEGGGVTLAHLLAAGVVDRLHLVTAPLLVGAGRASVSGVLSETLAGCPRPRVTVQPLGDDWLFDCAFGEGA